MLLVLLVFCADGGESLFYWLWLMPLLICYLVYCEGVRVLMLRDIGILLWMFYVIICYLLVF